MLEECTEEELRAIQLREKENSFLRKAEEDQVKKTRNFLNSMPKKILLLKRS